MIKFNQAIQLNFCNSQCSLETCLLHSHTPMGPGPAFTFAMLPWDLAFTCTHVLSGLRKHLKTRLKCVTIHFLQWRIKSQFLLNSRFGMITIWSFHDNMSSFRIIKVFRANRNDDIELTSKNDDLGVWSGLWNRYC